MYGIRMLAGVALVVAAAAAGGCAAAAGAGAATYIQAASPESAVNASLDRTVDWTLAAFRDLGIAVTKNELKDSGKVREIEGSGHGETIHVTLEPKADGTTNIEVTAKKNAVEYDKQYAHQVLARIMSQGS